MERETGLKDNVPAHDKIIAAALEYGKSYAFDGGHARQVRRLSLAIYDGLKELHGLGKRPRLLLECAALLHDIGFTGSNKKTHHKRAMELIQKGSLTGLSEMERILVGLVARYHRKTLPSVAHDTYRVLDMRHRRTVDMLAACLRVADGLDRTHQCVVGDVSCRVTHADIVLTLDVHGNADEEVHHGMAKGDLMQIVFSRWLHIIITPEKSSGEQPLENP
jgi:exopolyphosphatase/guanosine-5'-triphosphate,3'-diphosphate pyrophosphatase